MGLKLERQRRKVERVKENTKRLTQDSFDLERQQRYIELIKNARDSNLLDDSVEKSIDEISNTHLLETKRVKIEQNITNQELNELINNIKHEIHKLEEGLARLENIAKYPYKINLSKELVAYQKHIEEWKKLLDDLGKVKNSQRIEKNNPLWETFITTPIEEKNDYKALQTQFNALIVQSQQFDWNISLNNDERKALEAYTNNQYRNINGYLRGNRTFPIEYTELGKFYIWNLHNSLSRATTAEPITVYRGLLNNAVLNEYKNVSDYVLIGKVIRDPAFMSTTFELNIAKEYSKDTILKISVPKGVHGIYIGEYAAYAYEKEFLLDKDQIMKIDSVEHREGKRYLNVSILAERHNMSSGVNPFKVIEEKATERKQQKIYNNQSFKNKKVQSYEDLIQLNKEAEPEFQKMIADFQREIGGEINTRFKSEERINEKVQDDYKGDYSRCIDVLGGRLIFDTELELLQALEKLKNKSEVIRIKNMLYNPNKYGYRGIHMNIILSNGVIGEIQLHHKVLLAINNLQHVIYEYGRSGKNEIAVRSKYSSKGLGCHIFRSPSQQNINKKNLDLINKIARRNYGKKKVIVNEKTVVIARLQRISRIICEAVPSGCYDKLSDGLKQKLWDLSSRLSYLNSTKEVGRYLRELSSITQIILSYGKIKSRY